MMCLWDAVPPFGIDDVGLSYRFWLRNIDTKQRGDCVASLNVFVADFLAR